MHTGNQIDS